MSARRAAQGTAGECHGRLGEQGHSDRQSRRGPGNPAHPGRPPDRQSARGDLGKLARQGHRRAQGKDRVAPRGDLQRRALQDRRAVSEEGLEGLSRRPAADAQVQRQGRRREIFDRGGAAELQLDAHHARHPRRRWRRRAMPPTTTSARRARPRRASRRWPARRQARRHGRRDSVLDDISGGAASCADDQFGAATGAPPS